MEVVELGEKVVVEVRNRGAGHVESVVVGGPLCRGRCAPPVMLVVILLLIWHLNLSNILFTSVYLD